MTDISFALPSWGDWLMDHPLVAEKIGDAEESNIRDYFSRVHAACEAQLRQILFIGFRLNGATYANTSHWLYHNDVTPDRIRYPKLFNALYSKRQGEWEKILFSHPTFNDIWSLWLDFSKVIRNHIQHGVRDHKDGVILTATLIDKALLMSLNDALKTTIGGNISDSLTNLNPRLPRGDSRFDLNKLAGLKRSGKRATPVTDVCDRMRLISYFQVVYPNNFE